MAPPPLKTNGHTNVGPVGIRENLEKMDGVERERKIERGGERKREREREKDP